MIESTRIVSGKLDYGRRGEPTGVYAYKNGCRGKVHEIKVGDVVCHMRDNLTFCSVVLKKDGRYGLMGFGICDLDSNNLTISVPYHKVPVEMLRALHGTDFEYVKEEVVEMTLDEIEELVGKKVKIVKGE